MKYYSSVGRNARMQEKVRLSKAGRVRIAIFLFQACAKELQPGVIKGITGHSPVTWAQHAFGAPGRPWVLRESIDSLLGHSLSAIDMELLGKLLTP